MAISFLKFCYFSDHCLLWVLVYFCFYIALISYLCRSKVEKMTDIITGNPMVVKMIVSFNRYDIYFVSCLDLYFVRYVLVLLVVTVCMF